MFILSNLCQNALIVEETSMQECNTNITVYNVHFNKCNNQFQFVNITYYKKANMATILV